MLNDLRKQLRRWESQRTGLRRSSTGVTEVDAGLPDGGLLRGTLAEWLAEPGSGAGTLALLAAREALEPGGAIVLCDPRAEFNPAVALHWGLSLDRLVLLRPRNREDLLWACDQALRCPGVSATVAEFDRLNDREFRRLQLSAEEGGGLGLLLRPCSAQKEFSWADVRWKVEPRAALADVHGRWVQLELLRCRGRIDGGAWLLEIDDVTHAVRLAPPLASAKVAPSRATRAG